MRHDNPQTVKGSTHVCKRAGCKLDNYKERPRKDRSALLGSAMPKKNARILDAKSAMKSFPRSERQARRVAAQQEAKRLNEALYQNANEWKRG